MENNSSNFRKGRPTIGLQITNLVEEYPKLLWRGVVDMAEEMDVNIVIFRSESINTPWGYGYQCNVINDLMHENYLDALIIASGTICNFISKKQFNDYIDKMKRIPLISISIQIEEIPSIILDNSSGIIDAVEHLVSVHNRKNIAFIKGPDNNTEAQIRYQAYQEGMKKCNIPVDLNLVVAGNFIERSGLEAVIELLDIRKVKFDAIIASNDNMAIGAMNELLHRGFELPEQVAVIGFDNIPDCENISPPLTSIKQPIYLEGRKAVELAVKLIKGEKAELISIYPTSLIYRSSCGCLGTVTAQKKQIEKKLKNHKEIIEEIDKLLSITEYAGNKDKIVYKTVSLMIDFFNGKRDEIKNSEELLRKLSKTMNNQMKEGVNIIFWKDVLEIMLHSVSDEKIADEYQETIRQAINIVLDLFQSIQISARVNAERMELNTRLVVQELISSLSIEELMNKITELLPRLKLKSCYIFAYNKVIRHIRGNEWISPKRSKLLLAFDADSDIKNILPVDYLINIEDFIPEGLANWKKRHTYLVAPVYFLAEQYGYIIFDMNTKDGNVYDLLSLEISSTYRSSLLLEERQSAEMKLRRVLSELEETNRKLSNLSETDELTGLYNRRGFMSVGEQSLMLAQRMKKNGVLFFVDLDGLKGINDTYGHDAGDVAIKACAEILNNVFRKMDILARLGGDEFIALTINTDKGSVEMINKRLDQSIHEYNDNHNYPYKFSMSIGESSFTWDEEKPLSDLMAEADKQLYYNKRKKKEEKANSNIDKNN